MAAPRRMRIDDACAIHAVIVATRIPAQAQECLPTHPTKACARML